MKRRRLGNSGFETSAIGLGCTGLSQGYGPVDDEASSRTILASIEVGVTLLDTAQSYGGGHNEQLIGSVLKTAGAAREKLQLATKIGITRTSDGVHLDAKPDRIRQYCDASLKRLGTDFIDLYYLHRIDPEVPVEDSVGAMADLVAAGKVRFLGLSEVTSSQLEKAAVVHPITAVQFEWSLMWREPETSIIPVARKLGAGLVAYSPMGRGFLSGTLQSDAAIQSSQFRKSDPRFGGAALEQNRRQLENLQAFASSRGITPGQLSLAWLLAQGQDVVPIPGTRRPERALENAASAEIVLSEGDLQQLASAIPDTAWAGNRSSFAVPTSERIAVHGFDPARSVHRKEQAI